MLRKLKNIAHLGLSILANILYRFPGKRITVVGVTGTDGKTTTCSLIYHILKSSGRKAVMITTVGAYFDGKKIDTGFHVTTPTAFAIQRLLRQAVNEGYGFAVIETSSHGIDQNRIWGIDYKVAAITNITHEHLDYHPTFDAYISAKFKFLQSADCAVINIDDPNIAKNAEILKNKVLTYSRKGKADLNLEKFRFASKLFGSFNDYNILAAAGVCRELGLPDDVIKSAITTFEAPDGRQNIVYDGDFKVMVDFAHTPNSIENVLREAKATNPARLVHLFGAPGKRDESKRPLMGAASSKYADVMIITADDPRDESVAKIIDQIRKGVTQKYTPGENLFLIEDRRKAIEFAINNAKVGDFLVLTGKGHEPTLALANQELPWNEKEIVKGIIDKKTASR